MKKVKTKGIFLAAIVLAGMMLATARMPVGTAASQTDINNAIEEGLAYLNSTQASDGHWGGGSYPVACTAMAVLSFENAPNNHFGWNLSDPYQTTVQKGLDWLFTQANIRNLTIQAAGDPDTNGNGIGIYFSTGDTCYQTPMVLMAIVASQNKAQIATTGPANVTGRSYFDIVTDIVDWIAWAQNDAGAGGGRGGWRYEANYGSSDNSVSQWPVLGLMAAEGAWSIAAPPWVRSELNYWIAADQDLTGNNNTNSKYGSFGYTTADYILGGVIETATGILELTYVGASSNNASIIAAEGYINKMWNYYDGGWNVNIGNLYAMYAVMKAMRETTPPVQFIANYDGTQGVEWYNGTGEYADALIANQSSDGSWVNWKSWYEYLHTDLSTAFGVLILEYQIIRNQGNLEVTVVNAVTNSTINGSIVTIQGPDNRWNVTGSDGDGKVAFFNITVGSYNVTASMAGYFPNSTFASVHQDETTNCTISLEPMIVHDVAVVDVTPECNRIYQGKLCYARTNVTVANLGNATEDFNVTVYPDNDTGGLHHVMGTQQVLGLVSGEVRILTFLWNTTNVAPCYLYNITACASVVPDEANIMNNNMSSPTLIKVKLFGDVNGDGKVDGKDVALAALSLGSYGPNFLYQGCPPAPRWNQDADVSNDYKIDGKDSALISLNFGKACTN
jgi:hypothetical protein